MKVFKYTTLCLVLALPLAAFNNCGMSGLDSKAFQLSSQSEDENREHLGHGDHWCKASLLKASSSIPKVYPSLNGRSFGPDSQLMVIANSQCLRNQGAKTWLSAQILSKMDISSSAQISTQVSPPQVVTSDALHQLAQSDPCIVSVDEDATMQLFALPNDPYYQSQQPYLNSVFHQSIAGSIYNSANGIHETVTIAVLDSGLDINHPDIKDHIARDLGGNLMTLNAIDNTTNVIDSGFHGTHVAGLIAATADNQIGISGVMGKNVRILPVKVSVDGTSVDMSAVVNGIYWAADNGADVINMSLGGPTERPTLKAAIEYAVNKGVFVLAASGNNGKVLSSSFKMYPAYYGAEIDGMITVGSYDSQSGALSSFSNRSPTFVDILAPGSHGSTGILSTVPANVSPTGYAARVNQGGSVYPIHGTSMATPVAAGAAALVMGLVKSRGYDGLPSQIEKIMHLGAIKRSHFSSFAKDGNQLNIQNLIQKVDQDTGLSISGNQNHSQARGSVGIARHPQSLTVQSGEDFELSVDLTSNSSTFVNYRWYRNNLLLPTAKESKLKIKSSSSMHAGVYHVEVYAGSNRLKSSTATVSVDGQNAGCP